MAVMAARGDLLVVVDDDGRATTYPASSAQEIVKILTTPATTRRSEIVSNHKVRELMVTLQPGEPGHAAASLRAAGFLVEERSEAVSGPT